MNRQLLLCGMQALPSHLVICYSDLPPTSRNTNAVAQLACNSQPALPSYSYQYIAVSCSDSGPQRECSRAVGFSSQSLFRCSDVQWSLLLSSVSQRDLLRVAVQSVCDAQK